VPRPSTASSAWPAHRHGRIGIRLEPSGRPADWEGRLEFRCVGPLPWVDATWRLGLCGNETVPAPILRVVRWAGKLVGFGSSPSSLERRKAKIRSTASLTWWVVPCSVKTSALARHLITPTNTYEDRGRALSALSATMLLRRTRYSGINSCDTTQARLPDTASTHHLTSTPQTRGPNQPVAEVPFLSLRARPRLSPRPRRISAGR
jgi:hypothetical protein